MIITRRHLIALAAAPPLASAWQQAGNQGTPAGVRKIANQPYAGGTNRRQMLDLYIPEHADSPLPVVVWIHGGAWRSGSKEQKSPALPLTEFGFAVAQINYRLSSTAQFPAQLEDCKSAVRWLRRHAKEYNLDPYHIAVWGSSAGGHLAAMVGVTSPADDSDAAPHDNGEVSARVQAVVDWYGPTDFTQMDAQAPPDAPFKHDAPDSPEADLIGGPVQKNRDKARRANPITYITRDDPPFLIIHGDKDATVPVGQSRLLHAALERAGVSVFYHEIPGAGHGPGIHTPENFRRVREFLTRFLKPATIKPAPPKQQGGSAPAAEPPIRSPKAKANLRGR
jgi:acetyl esterase/lipase